MTIALGTEDSRDLHGNRLESKNVGSLVSRPLSSMRLDRFLKLARIVKRRTLAKELCDEGVVFLNGTAARAGREIKVGDRVLLRLRNRRLEIEIEGVPKRTPSTSGARALYQVLVDDRTGNEEFASVSGNVDEAPADGNEGSLGE